MGYFPLSSNWAGVGSHASMAQGGFGASCPARAGSQVFATGQFITFQPGFTIQ
jgi:hypothetical protein